MIRMSTVSEPVDGASRPASLSLTAAGKRIRQVGRQQGRGDDVVAVDTTPLRAGRRLNRGTASWARSAPTKANVLPDDDSPVGQVPRRFFQRDGGDPNVLLRGDRAQRRAGATAEAGMVEHGPDPRLRVREVLHEGLRNHASAGAIGVSISPRTSAVPARLPTRPPARPVLAVMGTIFATSRSRLRMITVSPPAARRMSSLARSRNSPILTRFMKTTLAKLFGDVKPSCACGSRQH